MKISDTYRNLLKQLDPKAAVLSSELYGTLIAMPYPKPESGIWRCAVIDSYRSKKLRFITAKSLESIEKYFVDLVEFEERQANERALDALKRKERANTFLSKLAPGVILYDSWGYEQTNVEFYIVREIKGTKVKIQELGHTSEHRDEMSCMSCYVMPDIHNPIGEVIEKTVKGSRIRICSSISLGLWDGEKKYKSWYA